MKIVFRGIAVLVVAQLGLSCSSSNSDKEQCNGEPLSLQSEIESTLPVTVKITGLRQPETVIFEGYDNQTNNIKEVGQRQENPLYSELAIRVSTRYTDLFANKKNPLAFFINSAVACTLVEPDPFLTSNEILRDLNVTSSETFDDEHPAGSSLKDIIDIHYRIAYDKYEIKSLMEFLDDSPNAPVEFSLMFSKGPSMTLTHQFTISYTMEGKEALEVESDLIGIEIRVE